MVPAVIIVLLIASVVAFAVSRFSFRFNLFLLMLFTAGNLLPPQVIIMPLYRLYLSCPCRVRSATTASSTTSTSGSR